ncbi:RNA-directed DNA polymerase, eukaryota, reverse transcriptase zinc-binding domain protein [Tanacetum coccineum]
MGPKRVALKVDIQKAYDTVNWQFLEVILKGFGFHARTVEWVMRCVSTTSFSICVNGQSYGYFKGGRGLRHRDLMSPYLFRLVMEILTLIIKRKVEQNNNFQYHFGCKKLKITNVCFADDLLMFCHANKSSYYNFGCLNDEEKHDILDIMPFKVEKLPIRYLVVPLTSKRIIIKECKSLIDKVESRVSNWKNNCLSYAVRVIKDINKLLKNFLWNQNDGTKGRAKVTWKNVCRFKQKGGLRLKDLGVWNKAMIVKHLCQGTKLCGGKDMEGLCGFSVSQTYKDLLNDDADVVWDNNWSNNVAAFARRYNGNSISSIIRRLCIAASVYLIWQERNNRIFRDEERSSEDLYKMLNEIVRMRPLSLKVKDTMDVRKAQECEDDAAFKYKDNKGREM